MELYLSLGSNSGDRAGNITEAVRRLSACLGVQPRRMSSIIETEPWGFESPDRFLNAAVMFETQVEPAEVLRLCKKVEAELGRTDSPRFDATGRRVYSSRPIDIDILTYGDLEIDTETLKIPHPLMWKRDFVMIPLREIASGKFKFKTI